MRQDCRFLGQDIAQPSPTIATHCFSHLPGSTIQCVQCVMNATTRFCVNMNFSLYAGFTYHLFKHEWILKVAGCEQFASIPTKT